MKHLYTNMHTNLHNMHTNLHNKHTSLHNLFPAACVEATHTGDKKSNRANAFPAKKRAHQNNHNLHKSTTNWAEWEAKQGLITIYTNLQTNWAEWEAKWGLINQQLPSEHENRWAPETKLSAAATKYENP